MTAHFPKKAQAVHLRHINVTYNKVDFLIVKIFKGFVTIAHAGYFIAFLAEEFAQPKSGVLLIIYNKNLFY